MIAGIGIDIVEVDRIRKSLTRWGDRFQSQILNELEVRQLRNMDSASAYLARQFAAKEAVAKALGTGMNKGVSLKDILVLREKSGAPFVQLLGGAKEQAKFQGIASVLISISEEKAYAIAYAMAIKEPSDLSDA